MKLDFQSEAHKKDYDDMRRFQLQFIAANLENAELKLRNKVLEKLAKSVEDYLQIRHEDDYELDWPTYETLIDSLREYQYLK